MINRKILNELKEWEEKKIKEPIMLIGARQTGKTFILDYFCKKYYENYIYINLEKQKDYLSFFEESLEPEIIISKIEALRQEKIDIENTVLFFDEIQVSEKAINSLKYFCESETNYRIVTAGSLLGVKINRFNSSFPVGKVYFKYLYPVSFEEFLEATGNNLLKNEIERCFKNNEKLSIPLHKKAKDIYTDYLYIGGMPMAVKNYIENNMDIVSFNNDIQRNIINSYIADMAKYTNGTEVIKTTKIYNSLPEQLAKVNKKFMYNILEEKGNKRKFESSIDWLTQSGLVLMAKNIKVPEVPLKAYEKNNHFKLYLGDVGLLSNLCELTTEDVIKENINMFKGVITENFVACEFASNKLSLNYWESESLAEIDFVLNIKGDIIPIEVKASENTKSRSLNVYMKKYNPKYAIRISGKNFGFANNIKSVPLYATYLIGKK